MESKPSIRKADTKGRFIGPRQRPNVGTHTLKQWSNRHLSETAFPGCLTIVNTDIEIDEIQIGNGICYDRMNGMKEAGIVSSFHQRY